MPGGHGIAESMSREATILIVDDEPDVREVLEEYLAGRGFTAIGAESAAAARGVPDAWARDRRPQGIGAGRNVNRFRVSRCDDGA